MEKLTTTEIRAMANVIHESLLKKANKIAKDEVLEKAQQIKDLIDGNVYLSKMRILVESVREFDKIFDNLSDKISTFNKDYNATVPFTRYKSYDLPDQYFIDAVNQVATSSGIYQYQIWDLPPVHEMINIITSEWTKCGIKKCDAYDYFTKLFLIKMYEKSTV